MGMMAMTARTEPILPKIEVKRLQDFLQAAVGHFRIGEDAAGIKNFLSAMEELEQAVEANLNLLQPRMDMKELLPAIRELYFYIKNQDITGITDLLEDTLYPQTEEWLKRCDSV